MKKVLGFIGATIYTAFIAVVLYQIVFWVTPWFMGQDSLFLILFWLFAATPLFLLLVSMFNLVYGIPIGMMADNTPARIIPTIILVAAGGFGCMLPWALTLDYSHTKTMCFAVSLTIVIAAIFIAAIIALWLFRKDKDK